MFKIALMFFLIFSMIHIISADSELTIKSINCGGDSELGIDCPQKDLELQVISIDGLASLQEKNTSMIPIFILGLYALVFCLVELQSHLRK